MSTGSEDTGSPDVDRSIEAPATLHQLHVEVRFTDAMLTWGEFANNPTIQKLRDQLYNFISRSKK
jgi:hypothetical protein